MNHRKKTEEYDLLLGAILTLKTKEECRALLDDLCTIKEMDAMSQRIEVARMLKNNETYLDIAAKTGASTATISRVNRALNYGSEGYNTVLGRLSEKEKSTGDKSK